MEVALIATGVSLEDVTGIFSLQIEVVDREQVTDLVPTFPDAVRAFARRHVAIFREAVASAELELQRLTLRSELEVRAIEVVERLFSLFTLRSPKHSSGVLALGVHLLGEMRRSLQKVVSELESRAAFIAACAPPVHDERPGDRHEQRGGGRANDLFDEFLREGQSDGHVDLASGLSAVAQ